MLKQTQLGPGVFCFGKCVEPTHWNCQASDIIFYTLRIIRHTNELKISRARAFRGPE